MFENGASKPLAANLTPGVLPQIPRMHAIQHNRSDRDKAVYARSLPGALCRLLPRIDECDADRVPPDLPGGGRLPRGAQGDREEQQQHRIRLRVSEQPVLYEHVPAPNGPFTERVPQARRKRRWLLTSRDQSTRRRPECRRLAQATGGTGQRQMADGRPGNGFCRCLAVSPSR